MLAFLVTTGSYDDTQTYGVIVAPDEPSARFQLDTAQLHLAREARALEPSQRGGGTIPVLRMEPVELLNGDVLVSHEGDDPAAPRLTRGTVASS
jgi:hypothetical protein